MFRSFITILSAGFAMFSMFFGSGNVVFPVLVGQVARNQSSYAIMGLMITAVLVPFIGLFSMFLFDGDYLKFFKRLGTIPAWFIVITIMSLIGPFGVIPRCVVISYSTVQTFWPTVNLFWFSLLSCFLIYFCSSNRSKIVDILGIFLTPVLLFSLMVIIVKGVLSASPDTLDSMSKMKAFTFGLHEGYNMMDLFAAFMFSSIILKNMRRKFSNYKSKRKLLLLNLSASCIGVLLLGGVYAGMCFVSSSYSTQLNNIPPAKILSTLAVLVLGDYAGVVVCCAVALACLTTAITLSVVFSEFICKEVFFGKMHYRIGLIVTLVISFFMSSLDFSGIQSYLVPVLVVSLPCLMLMTILNLSYKLLGFRPVKLPVFAVFILSCYFYFT